MTTTINDQTVEDLVSAFSHKLTMETDFYWKIKTRRVIEVSMLDYALVSDCIENYESGLDKNEEREIKEAIIAIEKKRNTHLSIPRTSTEERIEIMKKYISSMSNIEQKEILERRLDKLISFKDANMLELFQNGIKVGFDMNNLIIGNEELNESWTFFYRQEIKSNVNIWLNMLYART